MTSRVTERSEKRKKQKKASKREIRGNGRNFVMGSISEQGG